MLARMFVMASESRAMRRSTFPPLGGPKAISPARKTV